MHIDNHHYSISGYSALSNRTLNSLNVAGKAYIDHLTCTNTLTCAGKMDVSASSLHTVHISGSATLQRSTAVEITVSGHLRAEDCPNLGSIQASGQLHLIRCPQVSRIQSSGSLSLLQTNVSGDVHNKGSELQVTDSRIEGTLTSCGKRTVINQSHVKDIVVKKPQNGGLNFFSGNIFSCNFNMKFGSFPFIRHNSASSEQIVELDGPHCVVDTISFAKGTVGRVILKNGAKVIGSVLRGTISEA